METSQECEVAFVFVVFASALLGGGARNAFGVCVPNCPQHRKTASQTGPFIASTSVALRRSSSAYTPSPALAIQTPPAGTVDPLSGHHQLSVPSERLHTLHIITSHSPGLSSVFARHVCHLLRPLSFTLHYSTKMHSLVSTLKNAPVPFCAVYAFSRMLLFFLFF